MFCIVKKYSLTSAYTWIRQDREWETDSPFRFLSLYPWHLCRGIYSFHLSIHPFVSPFYGPAILLHILKTICWRNVVLGIIEQYDSKINLVNYICWSVTCISWSIDFALYHCHRLINYFIHLEMASAGGVFVSLRALALVYISYHPIAHIHVLSVA